MRRPGNKFRWRAAIKRHGEPIVIRRLTGAGLNRPQSSYEVRARVIGYQPQQLIGSITQGDRRVLVLVEDLIKAQFPLPVTNGDSCVVRGRALAIQSIDDNTHRDGTEVVALEMQVRG